MIKVVFYRYAGGNQPPDGPEWRRRPPAGRGARASGWSAQGWLPTPGILPPHVLTLIILGEGGGHIEPYNAKISVKCLVSHHSIKLDDSSLKWFIHYIMYNRTTSRGEYLCNECSLLQTHSVPEFRSVKWKRYPGPVRWLR